MTVKGRVSTLRKRSKPYMLSELPREEWPAEVKLRQSFLEHLRPQWEKYGLGRLLYETDIRRFLVPGTQDLLAYPYSEKDTMHDGLLLYHGSSGEYQDLGLFTDAIHRVVWITKNSAPVVLFHQVTKHEQNKYGQIRLAGVGFVSCIGTDRGEYWRFAPQLQPGQVMAHISTSADGIITLFAPGSSAALKADAQIWQIDGETGLLLRSCSIPSELEVQHLVYVASLHSFVYCCRQTGRLVFLNEQLEQTHCLTEYEGSYYIEEKQFVGHILWNSRDCGFIWLYDLCSGTKREVILETRAYLMAVLPDGKILGVNRKQNVLTVFLPDGSAIFRCTVPGSILRVICDGENVFLMEIRGQNTHGLIYDALFDETTTHIWRLDDLSLAL